MRDASATSSVAAMSGRPVTRDVYISDGKGPAASDRIESSASSHRAVHRTARRPVKILFVSANTRDGDRLALDEEYRAIELRVRTAAHRAVFQLIPKLAARGSDLQDALLEHCPDVVHFACHGTAQGDLLLGGDGPGSESVSVASLELLLGVLRDNLVLVVFNACFASIQADAIGERAGLAIGMRAPIEDRTAIAFAAALYGALAYGRSVKDAFELGRAALDAHHRSLPQLFHRTGLDPEKVYLVPTPRSRKRRILLATAAICAAFAIACWIWSHQTSPPPLRRGMVPFAATSVRPGVFDVSRRPQCPRPLDASEDCAELAAPDRVAPVHVSAFEIDVNEVRNSDLADWLNATNDHWIADRHGSITARPDGKRLALASEQCFGALKLTPEGRVVVSSDKASWPAVCMTWYGATEYCRAQRKRLPLAIEWELAAKGASGRPFPWGSDLPHVDEVAFGIHDGPAAHPRDVGTSSLDVSPEGVHDLAGNVAEWVDDGNTAGGVGMVRGGTWGSRDACHVLTSTCQRVAVDVYMKDLGFRCAASVIKRP
jgi:formylglycine-generating enzyme required for sulfatase activity